MSQVRNAVRRQPGGPALRVLLASSALLGSLTLVACSSGPSTRDEVCGTFDELGKQMLHVNGIFDNPVFHKADDLSSVARRYQGTDLSADATALHAIAKSNSTNGLELERATSHIADLCGHPLGVTGFGGLG